MMDTENTAGMGGEDTGFELTDEDLAELVAGAETAAGETGLSEQTVEAEGAGAANGSAPAAEQVAAAPGGVGAPAAGTGDAGPDQEPPALSAMRQERDEARRALEAERADRRGDPVNAQLAEMAKGFGLTPALFLDQLAVQQLAQGFVAQGVDEQVAAQRAQLAVQQQKADRDRQRAEAEKQGSEREAQARRAEIAADFNRFTAQYPEAAKDWDGTWKAITPYLQKGMKIGEAWRTYQNEKLSAQVKDLSEKLAAKETAHTAAGASTGSRAGAGGEQRDPYLEGWG